MLNSTYFFGLGEGHLRSKRARRIAHEHGAEIVNYADAPCTCGHNCAPYTCRQSWRYWFAIDDQGEPSNGNTAQEVMSALAADGIIPENGCAVESEE